MSKAKTTTKKKAAKQAKQAKQAKTGKKPGTHLESKARSIRPSQLKRFYQCPGSLAFKGNQRPTKDRFADQYGTLAHSVFEWVVKAGDTKSFSISFEEIWNSFESSAQGFFNLNDYNLFLEKQDELKDWASQVYSTIKIDYEYLVSISRTVSVRTEFELPRVYLLDGKYLIAGTIDCLLISDKAGYVYDFKTGFLDVPAEGNLQLQAYAHGIWNSPALAANPELELEAVIIQPSLNTVSRAEIQRIPLYYQHLERGLEQYENAKDKKTKLQTGPECRFCEFAEVCPEFRKRLDGFLKPEFHGEEMLRFDAWKDILEFVKPTIKALEAIQSDALEMAREGYEIPGFELQYKPAQRRWTHNIPAVSFAKMLGLKKGDVIKEKLESPAGIEKLLKTEKAKARFAEVVAQPSFPQLKFVGNAKDSEEVREL